MFRFAHTEILYLLLVIPVFILLFSLALKRRKKSLQEFGEADLLGDLMPMVSYRRPIYKFAIIMLAFAFLVIGIAGPQFGSKIRKIDRKGVELVIALDVSNSMLANDIKPNRLAKAKSAISHLVEKLGEDKIGLIVFAGEAYTQLPITSDYSSARLFLSGINTDIVPVQGTAIGSAIDLARKSFTPNEKSSKAIIVITDGENHRDDAVASASKAREEGIIVHTIGMGLPQGAPIPVKGNPGQFHKDREGNVVVSRLNEDMLKKIAAAGEGAYIRANNTRVGLNALFKEINKMDKTQMESNIYSDYIERFQYFVFVALFLLLLDFLVLERKNRRIMKIKLF
ncbi:MAG: VWA domain-containing protein [Marinifilaceae bacterium]